MIDLNTIWFLLVGVLIVGYAILDGFDLGVGVLQLFTKDEKDRRINLNAIGPVWDGNEVWLLTGGGALFAAFPVAYATVFSGFYIAFMLLLTALIFRAVSFEFRKYSASPAAKKNWDWAFALGSLVPSILYGVAIGNLIHGLPIAIVDGKIISSISFLGLLNPYSLLIGILSLLLFTLQGSIYMTLKSDGALRERMLNWANKLWIAVVAVYVLATVATIFAAPHMFDGLLGNPLFWVAGIVLFAAILYIPIGLKSNRVGYALLSSSMMIAGMTVLFAISLFPRLVPSSIDLAKFSLTIYNASSTPRTLQTMLIIALIGVPLVLVYTIFIYRVFRGKVVLDEESY
jgi:cytochrome bd ubiquinol oxidase subunit II